ncbi:DUF3080 domain-containing protein [Simiduia sp. 21SJ11W-1]|uniref:DUF3080 family protein n=1 Tax=Simiduia sp. 21SJ11W-1 TaxID=2909669 RepID=UPI00209D4DE9|nr:DUF3080 family protein [Simiduia sp. 21SJ11W-1]UTA48083.1 DUF3080 domain-containing protein [Simiduia sp. 21SJ11W-1]
MNVRLLRVAVMLCALAGTVLIPACVKNERIEAKFENYHYRLSNVFDFERRPIVITPPSRYPTERALLYQEPELQIDLLDFLRLSPCELQRLLGERNSSLGRLQPPSLRWVYHLEFIAQARACIESLPAGQLRAALVQASATKQAFLLRARANVTWGSAEFQQLFSGAQRPGEVLVASANQAQALRELQALLAEQLQAAGSPEPRNFSHASTALEQRLAVIGAYNGAGRLAADMATGGQWLEQLNQQLVRAAARRPLCPKGRLTERGKTMERVFQLFYVGEIQPWLSQISQRRWRLGAALQALMALEPAASPSAPAGAYTAGALPDALVRYWQQVWDLSAPASTAARFDRATRAHVQFWQTQLRQCGRMPGADSSG